MVETGVEVDVGAVGVVAVVDVETAVLVAACKLRDATTYRLHVKLSYFGVPLDVMS